MTDDYRLIWFQHFQKAAGSSIVLMAERNGEKLYPNHNNGNPHGENGEEIRLWDLEEQELTAFIDRCMAQGVTFVATEKFGPDFSVLIKDPRVCLITCLREPLKRFVSHYYFSYYTARTDLTELEDFASSIFISTMPDYYCRIFSRHHADPEPIASSHYESAMSVLKLFDFSGVIESETFIRDLTKFLGWQNVEIRANRTSLNLTDALKVLVKCRLDLIWRRIRHPVTQPGPEFSKSFLLQNKWDYRLYRVATQANV